MRPVIEGRARFIIDTLHRHGYRALVVGGSIRDGLMGRVPSDMDIVTDAPGNEICRMFEKERVRKVGRQFSLFLVNGVEVACCRGREESGRFPLNDLGMRDFTVNSMAFDPETGEWFDPFSGRDDLNRGIVRFTGNPEERITEDPLRIVRACRFAAMLGGSIERASFVAIRRHATLLKEQVAPERIRDEIVKAMGAAEPSVFFENLHRIGGLQFVLPCLDRCCELDGGPHHAETVFEHCMLAGNAVPRKYPLLRLAAFLHDTGKYDAATPGEKGITFAGHEKKFDAVHTDLKRLAFSNRRIEYILSIIRVHMRPLTPETGEKAVRRILGFLEAHKVTYRDFMRIRIADKKANLAKKPYTLHDIRVRLEKLKNESEAAKRGFGLKSLALRGEDVMNILDVPEGPRVGEALGFLMKKVAEEPSVNTQEQLEKLLLQHFRK
ncbi:MAG: CCA tRNA nucleotidyltransferase [Desulfarculaceae bacterium]|nr:CCA tRNA nucleotidyltransferase [Desulfarculaceae bacterium]